MYRNPPEAALVALADPHRLARMSRAEIRRAILDIIPLTKRNRRGFRAPPVRVPKTPELVQKVVHLGLTTDLTETQIANAVGLRNNGRVDEIFSKYRVERPLSIAQNLMAV